MQSLVTVNQTSEDMFCITMKITTGKITVIQVYDPTSLAPVEELEDFCNEL